MLFYVRKVSRNFFLNVIGSINLMSCIWRTDVFPIPKIDSKTKKYTYIINFNFSIFILKLIYIQLFSINLILFYFISESSLLVVFFNIIIKWECSEFRFNSSFHLIFYTLVFSLPLVNLLNLYNRLNFYISEILNFIRVQIILNLFI